MGEDSKIIQTFECGSTLEFNTGQFDEWCVYLSTSKNEFYEKWCVRTVNGYAPKDEKYFEEIVKLAQKHSTFMIYSDFIEIYDRTKPFVEITVLDFISEVAKKYGEDKLEIEILFCILYSGMIAEENKDFSVLGKRIKRLGIHQLLMDKTPLSAKRAANFSRGKKAYKYVNKEIPLNDECRNRGF